MARVRQEDLRMKIPAVIHLTRLGYLYLPPGKISRDPQTNILPGSLRAALRRTGGGELSDARFDLLMEDLREQLGRPDLGEAFYRTVRDGWHGLPLIAFEHPEANEFLVVPELRCGTGGSFFRPDLTLMVNGLPLAMIEVKTEVQEKGIRAEYDRMRERFRREEFRRFLQAAQVWAFSDNRESDESRFLPAEGVCYATFARGDFPLRVFPERFPEPAVRLRPVNQMPVREVFADLGVPWNFRNREFGRSLSPRTPTHRMLTALFSPDRFLFLLKYGIRYGMEPDAEGNPAVRKNLPTAEQFRMLLEARTKLNRGFRNWSLASRGAAGESAVTASLMEMLRENIPDSRLYWVGEEDAALRKAEGELRAWGVKTARTGSPERESLRMTEPLDDVKALLRSEKEEDFTGTRVFLLVTSLSETEGMRRFRNRLRRADPGAVMVHLTRSAEPERRSNYTYLLKCADGTLYCGWTNDLRRRIQAHNEGRGARYTRGRGPVKLVYLEEFESREEAMSREWHLKRLSRAEKEKLIAGWTGAYPALTDNETDVLQGKEAAPVPGKTPRRDAVPGQSRDGPEDKGANGG